ncbi:MAG TPA: glycosyltransferase [Gemmatirosa sp.]
MSGDRRIAILSTMAGMPWGGSEELWADAADAALDDGQAIGLFLHRWPQVPARVQALVARGASLRRRGRSIRGPAERALARIAARPVSLPAVPGGSATVRGLAAFRPDVVIASEGTLCALAAMRDVCDWLAQARTPYVTVCQHVADDHIPTPALQARAVACYRDAAPAAFVARGNVESAERVLAARLPHAVVLANPVNLRGATALPAPPPGPARFASVARLDARTKGQDVLFVALSSPAWRARDWVLRLFGTGPDEAYLRRLAAAFGVADRVEFAGHCADVRAIWAEHDLLVLSSRSEGTPLALVEAMLCGRPAVVTDVGGSAEWVEDGATGWIAAAPTPHAVADALERAWNARGAWAAMGARAHHAAAARRDPEPGRTLLDLAIAAAS